MFVPEFLVKQLSAWTQRVFIVLAVFAAGAQLALAADVSITPAAGSYAVGQTITLRIQAVPNGADVNAVEADLSYNTDVLSVVSTSKDGSAFSLWTTEPSFDNSAGSLSFGGGSPTPFSNQSTVLTVTLRADAAGTGNVSFGDVSILAADGQGTDVFENANGASFTIAASEPTPEPEPQPQPTTDPEPEPAPDEAVDDTITFGDPPRAPEVGSQVFLDPDVWYADTSGLFTWTAPFNVDAVAVEIATSSDNQPEENEEAIYEPPIEEFGVNEDNVSDGVQYLSIKYRNEVGWGVALNRQIKIDTTSPEPFEIDVNIGNRPGAFPELSFAAEDGTSGIARYEMTVADREPVEVTPDEARIGYLLSELEDGTYTVTVVAEDQAGNTRESQVAVKVTAGWTPPVEEEETGAFWAFITPINLFVLFLIVIITLLVITLWMQRKQHHDQEEKLRRETREIHDQMEKIFSALRDEMYDQINTITKRKRLSKKEREAVEALNQALEVSETLIDKEINDVKSILK